MSTDIAQSFFIGRLTRDVEVRSTSEGTTVGNFSLAINQWKGPKGEVPSFFDFTIWGKQCEGLAQFLVKGKQVGIIAEPSQDRWETDDGNTRSKVKFTVRQLQLLGGKGDFMVEDQQTGSYNMVDDPLDDPFFHKQPQKADQSSFDPNEFLNTI